MCVGGIHFICSAHIHTSVHFESRIKIFLKTYNRKQCFNNGGNNNKQVCVCVLSSSLDLQSLKYVYALMFAVEEVNSNNSLLPGLTLGYHILDNCGRYPWALQNAVTLVTGEEDGCSLTAASASTPENQTVDKGDRHSTS